MKLVALESIRHAGGTISVDQAFSCDDDYAQRLIQCGSAVTAEQYETLPWRGKGYWRVLPEWQGETVCIIGGGPSLTQAQASQTKGHKVIAINNAVGLAPWADILYFCDARWAGWHRATVDLFPRWRVTLENLFLQSEFEVRCLRDYGVSGCAPKSNGVTNGRNGGFQALHLAAWLGAARVLLLGFDMKARGDKVHWHPEHPVPTHPNIFPDWIRSFETLLPFLQKRGVQVINCTPDSALTMFPYQVLSDALGLTDA